MLKVLINAYACSPHTGSEPGMAWNWCINLAQYCELYIITEGEFKHYIESALETIPQSKNMHFYYLPVSEDIRQMCWNQGDWRFYKHYEAWQYRALQLTNEIIKEIKIDIIHQLNMIGFREPGYLWQIENIPFVWGPIGGLKQFPIAYGKNGGVKFRIFARIKNIINILQIKYDKRVVKALHRADLLISSIPDSYEAIKKYHKLESIIVPETGCFTPTVLGDVHSRFKGEILKVIWVGKFDFRKKLDIALKAISVVNNSAIELHVYGTGSAQQVKYNKELTQQLGIEKQIKWMGACANKVVMQAMQEAHVFLFTSVNEDTSTVVLEAISNCLPVMCFDCCGMSAVVDEKVGFKVPLTTPEDSACQFGKLLNIVEKDRSILELCSVNCRKRAEELSWDNKALKIVELYDKLMLK